MGRCRPKRRSMVIKQNQKRRVKLGKLRQKYVKTNSDMEKEKILEKVFKIASWLTKEKFLASVKKKPKKEEKK